MSDLNQSSSPQPGPVENPGKGKGSLIRQVVLIVVLLIFGGALAYDYLVARPAVEDAFEKVSKLEESNAGRDDVIEELGKPSESIKKDGLITDEYRFRSGMIFRTYKVYVVYTGAGMIKSITKNQLPEESAEQ